MTTKTKVKPVTSKEIDIVSKILGRLVIQGQNAHMKVPVQAIMGGLLLPTLVKNGGVDKSAPEVAGLLEEYSKKNIKQMLSPDPITVTEVVHERPVFRRIKTDVHKEKRIKRELDPAGRDILIRWWNVNQRLIPDNDPVCVTLTAQVNSRHPNEEPLSSMQIAGYFSHLCRMGLRTEEDREDRFMRSMKRGAHKVMPKYTQELLGAIKENWERERANEAARPMDHAKLLKLREKGINKPVIATF
jgi:hypothetical protein